MDSISLSWHEYITEDGAKSSSICVTFLISVPPALRQQFTYECVYAERDHQQKIDSSQI